MNTEENTMFDPEEMQSPFDAIKEVDGEGQLSASIKKNLNPSDNCEDAGSVSHDEAEAKAFREYEKFRRIQDKTLMSDFDKYIEGLEK